MKTPTNIKVSLIIFFVEIINLSVRNFFCSFEEESKRFISHIILYKIGLRTNYCIKH